MLGSQVQRFNTPPEKNNFLQRTTRVWWTKSGKRITDNNCQQSGPQRTRLRGLSSHNQNKFSKQNLTNSCEKERICKRTAD